MEKRKQQDHDPVNHPSHYCGHPSGIECIQVTEYLPFYLGNAIKYLWRAGEKGDFEQDCRKAIWYIEEEIGLRKRKHAGRNTPSQRATDLDATAGSGVGSVCRSEA